jgi:hypothetical protein
MIYCRPTSREWTGVRNRHILRRVEDWIFQLVLENSSDFQACNLTEFSRPCHHPYTHSAPHGHARGRRLLPGGALRPSLRPARNLGKATHKPGTWHHKGRALMHALWYFINCLCYNTRRKMTSVTTQWSEQRDVPVLHTGLISSSTGTSIPPKVENPGSTSVDGSRD